LGTEATVGSVVGVQKYVYDVFGPAVNMAARLQVFAHPMKIVAPEGMKPSLIDAFQVSDVGTYDIKGLGTIDLIDVAQNVHPMRSRLRN